MPANLCHKSYALVTSSVCTDKCNSITRRFTDTWDARYKCRTKAIGPRANSKLTIAAKTKCVQSARRCNVSYRVPPKTSHHYTKRNTIANKSSIAAGMTKQSVLRPCGYTANCMGTMLYNGPDLNLTYSWHQNKNIKQCINTINHPLWGSWSISKATAVDFWLKLS